MLQLATLVICQTIIYLYYLQRIRNLWIWSGQVLTLVSLGRFSVISTISDNMLMQCETKNEFKKRRMCIIGVGMSGLVATKCLWNMWRETFGSIRVKTPRHEYQFTDFPWPNHVTSQHPTHSEVMDYFQSYVVHFGLLDHIRFNSKVVKIRYIGQEYCERSLEHAGLWSKNGGPYADSVVWDVGVKKRNVESIEVGKEKSIYQ